MIRSLLLLCVALLTSCFSDGEHLAVSVIPEPQQASYSGERIKVSGVEFDTRDTQLAELALRFRTRMSIPVDGNGKVIMMKINDSLEREQYHLLIDDAKCILEGGSYASIMYGLITVEQLYDNRTMPKCEIWDKPQFEWRGAMLDASRHFWTVEQTKRFIDIMAYHKLNKFHWHLTDGIGWRVEIKRYPELTNKGAWRKERHPEAPWVNWELSTQDDSTAYGGFYTQEQIREIIAYADSKYIEVIPEIEMPGHSDAVLECYPNLKCFETREKTGEYCPGKDETYTFLENVLDEIASLFPSKYIHIGGDEVTTATWAMCPHCKKKMDDQNIFGVEKLQKYFTQQIVDHLKIRDKIVCGWDEITAFGVDSNVVVFSWTGMENGVKAAKNGNKVVMCPIDFVYFDHYQGFHQEEPQGWGGSNTLRRVYDFSVIPDGTDNAAAANILGGQANLWTENISTFQHVEYMILPRMAALSEALWTNPQKKSWSKFKTKIDDQMKRYANMEWNFSTSAIDPYIKNSWVDNDGLVYVNLANELGENQIHYTLDGTVPTIESPIYDTTIILDEVTTLMAAASSKDAIIGRIMMYSKLKTASSGKKVKYNSPYSPAHKSSGDDALTDSKQAFKEGNHPNWQGFEGIDMSVDIDLEEVHTISEVSANFFQHMGATSVMLPKLITVQVSTDGKKWRKIAKQEVGQFMNFNAISYIAKLAFVPQSARFVRVEAVNYKFLPPWHFRAGMRSWIFIDEIAIN